MDPNAKFETEIVPMPMPHDLKNAIFMEASFQFALVTAIALSMIPSMIISFVIVEREKHLKHMQLVSGVSLPAYWISIVIIDLFRTYVPVLIIIALMEAFGLNKGYIWKILLLYPIAIVP